MPLDYRYDVFISYAHQDNAAGWVSGFVDALRAEHQGATTRPLRVFFNDGVRAGTGGRAELLAALKQSAILVAMLSPAYFASDRCRQEWDGFVNYQQERLMPGESVVPVCIVDTPMLFDEQTTSDDAWLLDLRERQAVGFCDWSDRGPAVFADADVRARLQALDEVIAGKLRSTPQGPDTIPAHNRFFVGRAAAMRELRHALRTSHVSSITAVSGLGGVGKSALAFEYAHAYAADYPGGRFYIPCEGVHDLRCALVNGLPAALGLPLTDDDRADPNQAIARVRAALADRDSTLLVFDGVDDAKLLGPAAQADCLPNSSAFHGVVTTRLAPSDMSNLECMSLEPLSEPESVGLIDRRRPCAGPDDQAAAHGLAKELGGLAFALEISAVYLAQRPELSVADYLEAVRRDKLAALDQAGRSVAGLCWNRRTTLCELLAPTLDQLSPAERCVLERAASFDPDAVPLSEVRALAGQDFSELVAPPRKGRRDPWKMALRRLDGLHLLVRRATPETSRDDANALARTHPLVAAAIRGT